MFQTFDPPSVSASATAARVQRSRELLAEAKLDAFLVPRADEHQGEYVTSAAERLRWLTGFTGSAGTAVVARDGAALFVDGRYTVQARSQLDTQLFEILQTPQNRISDWLVRALAGTAVVGFDPWLHTVSEIERLTAALEVKGVRLRPVARNPIDRAWGSGRPKAPAARVVPHPITYAGKPAREKIADVQQRLKEDGQDAAVLSLPDSIAWLFNIRGGDVAHNPVALAFAVVPADGEAELFIAPDKIDDAAKTHLAGIATLVDPSSLSDRLARLWADNVRVRLDPDTAAWWLARRLGGVRRIHRGSDPCIALKARKNAVEISGTRTAHLRDGAAMARFLAWLDREAPKGSVDEIAAVRQLERTRAETEALREISFDTIAGSGPHGAIVHYRVTTSTNRALQGGELFLVDSGAQYLDGTTDVTRTVAIGTPTNEMRERFTLVLKGHIAIATARFPKGTRGIEIDAFARRALWDKGLDFDHGTGHGVGSYLSVHEGPQSISRRGMAVLEPGMIVSNEPGYYKEGAYGIRIENLVLVTPLEMVAGGEREVMAFETLTLVPIDRRLVKAALLTSAEVAWLDAYHARVRQTIGPELPADVRAWLEAATAPLA